MVRRYIINLDTTKILKETFYDTLKESVKNLKIKSWIENKQKVVNCYRVWGKSWIHDSD